MESEKFSVKHKLFEIDYNTEKDLWLKSSYTLRILVGILGILLPILLPLVLRFTDGVDEVLPSISHYYFTKSGPLFIAIMSLLAVFFIVYKGNKFMDFIISSIAGISALIVVFFPTENLIDKSEFGTISYIITVLEPVSVREMIHYFAAAIFLLSLAIMSFCQFTIPTVYIENSEKQIKVRHQLYRTLASIMIIAMGMILLGSDLFKSSVPESIHKFYVDNNLTFWLETIAVECFGISWLVKGGEIKFKIKSN
uniref:hypothetical protein n=1 Tax=Flavobacterium sp. TaxID=239 RepID=UPI004049476C